MNRLFSAALGLFLMGSVSAQTAYDALKISKSNPVMGTARYSAMGGAMGAFGADLSTMKDNPAGLGVYTKSDISLTPNTYITDDGSLGVDIHNFGIAFNFGNSGNKKGYVNSSIGVSYNRLANFKRKRSFKNIDYNNSMTNNFNNCGDFVYDYAVKSGLIDDSGNSLFQLDGELVDNSIGLHEKGSVGEWNISYGMNISNRFYWGIGVGFANLDYRCTSSYDEYGLNDQGNWYADNYYEATGHGFNFKFGVIGRVADWLRVGAAFHTPTFYNIDDYNDLEMGYGSSEYITSEYEWDLNTPLKAQVSLGFVIDKYALIGVEYNYQDYSAMKLSDDRGDFDEEKAIVDNYMNKTHTIKVGAEGILGKGFSARLGFAYELSPVDVDKKVNLSREARTRNFSDESKNMISQEEATVYPISLDQDAMSFCAGFGYKKKSFYVDFTFVHRVQDNAVYYYAPADNADVKETLHTNDIMATIGFKF